MSFPQLPQIGCSACTAWQISVHTLWELGRSCQCRNQRRNEKVLRKQKNARHSWCVTCSAVSENAASASFRRRCWCVTSDTPPPQTSTPLKWQLPTVHQCSGINGLAPCPRGYCSIITGRSPAGPLWCPRRERAPREASQSALRGLPAF